MDEYSGNIDIRKQYFSRLWIFFPNFLKECVSYNIYYQD